MIRLDNISLGYSNRTLIENLTINVKRGELTALVGRNGTGKSTLLRAIAGLGTPIGGEILLDGKKLSSLTSAELATTISFVTTDKVRIANLRCRDVVALGRAPYTNWIGRMQEGDKAIVEESLAAVGMSSYADKSMDKMSDGECQRIMIARALA
ncbi:MAG: ABC transporter ATP-binding protein, partial [Alistipes sp.]|nr:ABC transporter ATP-binding protein [Alistipes sp.]